MSHSQLNHTAIHPDGCFHFPASVRLTPAGDDSTRHPFGLEVLLVIELLGNSPAFDRHKISFDADAGIENCWIVDVDDHRIEVHSEPQAETSTYLKMESFGPGQSVSLILAGQTLTEWSVDTILPALDWIHSYPTNLIVSRVPHDRCH